MPQNKSMKQTAQRVVKGGYPSQRIIIDSWAAAYAQRSAECSASEVNGQSCGCERELVEAALGHGGVQDLGRVAPRNGEPWKASPCAGRSW